MLPSDAAVSIRTTHANLQGLNTQSSVDFPKAARREHKKNEVSTLFSSRVNRVGIIAA